jgi:hypothetical protein
MRPWEEDIPAKEGQETLHIFKKYAYTAIQTVPVVTFVSFRLASVAASRTSILSRDKWFFIHSFILGLFTSRVSVSER